MVGQRIGDEGEHGGEDGQRQADGHDGIADGQHNLDGGDLAVPELLEAVHEGVLPAEELDEADRLQDLLREAHSLVCNFINCLSPHEQPLDGPGQQRDANDQQGEAGEGAVGQVDDQQGQGDEAGDGSGPHDVEQTERLVYSVRIDVHQGHL